MQLMTFNSLLMFDIVFVFFLFLVGVTCLVYYLPPSRSSHVISCRHHARHSTAAADDDAETFELNSTQSIHQHNGCLNERCQFYRQTQKPLLAHQRACLQQQQQQQRLFELQQINPLHQQRPQSSQQHQQSRNDQRQGHQSHCYECIRRTSLLTDGGGAAAANCNGDVFCQVYNGDRILPEDTNSGGQLHTVLVESADVEGVQLFATESTGYLAACAKPAAVPQCCYVNAKQYDVKECTGPIDTV